MLLSPAIRFRRFTVLLSCLGLALAFSIVDSPPARATTTEPALVINHDFPDPDVSQFGSTYYAFSTNNSRGNVPTATAPAATGPWTDGPDALPTLGGWAGSGQTWAPDVSKLATGSYLLYYVAHSTSAGRQCIGTATASAPTGPFTPASQPLVCNAAEGGDIDPSSFVDASGSRYLVYKNDGNAIGQPPSIWLQPVAANGTTLTGARTKLLTNDRADEGGVIEAPVIVQRATRYVLFFSANGYGGDAYLTSYATSASLTGPYTKAYRPLMTTAGFDGAVRGPGGADIVGNKIVFHGWINSYSARGVYVAALGWASDLPVVRGSRVRYEAERGTLTDCVARDDAGASGGQVAARIDNPDSSVQLSVYAPVAGGYTAHVVYAAGYGDAQQTLSVNGGTGTVVSLPDHGWEHFVDADVDLSLVAGWNTLRFTHRTAYAELDYLEIA